MHNQNGQGSFLYLGVVTILSVFLILLNYVLGMVIPFRVVFLIGFVFALFIFVVWHSWITKGWQVTAVMLLSSYVIAFTAEALGVNFGLVFGKYHYTEALGVQVFGVPLLAALAWEPILYASYTITDILVPALHERANPWYRKLPVFLWMSAIGAMATTAWDMMIDPIAVSEGWWVWHNGGAYLPYLADGVPVQNFLGWLGVAFVINLVYRLISLAVPYPKKSIRLSISSPILLYASLFLTALGVTLTILRRADVALIGFLAMGPFLTIAVANHNMIPKRFISLTEPGRMDAEDRKRRMNAGR